MIFRAAVIDTNVVVAGLVTGDRSSPTAQVLDAMLEARFTYLISPALLAEYREVLLRPAIRKLHGLTDREVDRLLAALAANAVVREPRSEGDASPDPGDRHLWALSQVEPSTVLVTGDRRLQDQHAPDLAVLSPRSFVEGRKPPSR